MAPIDASDAPATEKKPFTAHANGIAEPPAAPRREIAAGNGNPIRNAAGASVATNAAVRTAHPRASRGPAAAESRTNPATTHTAMPAKTRFNVRSDSHRPD